MSEYQRNRQAEDANRDRLGEFLYGPAELEDDVTAAPVEDDADDTDESAWAKLYDDQLDDVADAFAEAEDVSRSEDDNPAWFVPEPREPTDYELAILGGLQHKPVYQDTVHPDEIRRRRLRNRDAKRARRRQRRARVKRGNRGNAAAVLWLMVASVFFGAAFFYSAPAHAATNAATIRIAITWSGGDPCNNRLTRPAPDNPNVLVPARPGGAIATCTNLVVDYQTVHPGEWLGANPDIGDADSVSCSVTNAVTGALVLADTARARDGHDASCLARW